MPGKNTKNLKTTAFKKLPSKERKGGERIILNEAKDARKKKGFLQKEVGTKIGYRVWGGSL